MLTKSKVKLITQLQQKKYRVQHKLFIAEGLKTINELVQSDYKLQQLYTTSKSDTKNASVVTENELKKISLLKTPQKAVAVFKIPSPKPIKTNTLLVALDAVRDPGNLGTIIRLCDWFGIRDLVCSAETVDCYNPKVVQATMGSLARVNISYVNLEEFLTETKLQKWGAFMNGENVYRQKLPNKGILVLGNEANGISKTVETLIDKKTSIPQYGKQHETESLNVATATAILLSEFSRQSTET